MAENLLGEKLNRAIKRSEIMFAIQKKVIRLLLDIYNLFIFGWVHIKALISSL
jgi:hypothetical protein